MPAAVSACPPDEELVAYGLGKASDARAGGVAAHLDSCVACVARLASLSADRFVGKVKGGGTALPAKSLSGLERSVPADPPPVPVDRLPPELAGLSQYTDVRELGRGGMGVVYLARNRLLDRREVLKVVGPQHLSRSGAKERFLQEVRAAARLQHPNVVAAYAVTEAGASLVFAMEYVPGEDLAQVVRANGPLGVPFACGYAAQVALGLQHAHEEGMVHRDIKPANLMLARKGAKAVVKILDFGLAKVASEAGADTGLTGDGRMMGTPDFMAPEQGRDAARADIYALGCTLYYLLAGRVPFRGATLPEVLLKHAQDEAEPLNLVRPEVPAEVAAVVARMMAKDPGKRYRTPAEVAVALKPFLKAGGPAPKSSPDVLQAAGETARPTGTAAPVAPAVPFVPVPMAVPPVAAGSVWESAVADVGTRPAKESPRRPRPAAEVEGLGERLRSREPRPRTAQTKAPTWSSRKIGLAVGVVLAVLVPLAWLATVVLRVETPNGALVVEINDAEVEARIKGGKLVLSGPDGRERYTLSPGERNKTLDAGDYTIRVVGADGLTLDTPEFTLKKGDKVTIRVTLDKKDVAKSGQAKDANAAYSDRSAGEYVLSIGGTVNDNRSLKTASDLPNDFRLTKFDLGGMLPNADVLSRFDGCKNVRYLYLVGTGVTDECLRYFKDCKSLNRFELGGTRVTAKGLSYFGDCKELDFLGLNDSGVNDEGLSQFKNCKNITTLELASQQGTDAGLSSFRDCKGIVSLNLKNSRVTDTSVEIFKECKNLHALSLAFTGVSGSCLLHFPNLRTLWLEGSQIGNEGLRYVGQCRKLEYLELEGTPIDDEGLGFLNELTALRRLRLGGTKVTEKGVAVLAQKLPKCRVEWSGGVVDPAAKASPAAGTRPGDGGR